MFLQTASPSSASHRATPRPRRGRPAAFTLIEILIVVIILGILASIVIPQFSNASHITRENTMKEDLRYLRSQITVFRFQHRDISPGYPGGSTGSTPTATDFIDQMIHFTNDFCATSAAPNPAYPYGPYLSSMPSNPLTGQSGLWVVTGSTMPAPDANQPYAWIYNPELQKLIANTPGNDADGVSYSTY